MAQPLEIIDRGDVLDMGSGGQLVVQVVSPDSALAILAFCFGAVAPLPWLSGHAHEEEKRETEEQSMAADGTVETSPGSEDGKSPTPEAIEAQLEAEGGQLEQRTLCNWAECSDALISKRLSSMEEEGRIIRIRLGRTKMVYLPEQVPELYGSQGDIDPDEYAGR